MIRVHVIPCSLSKEMADQLNRESGRIYTETMVWHYRIYRRTGYWFSMGKGCQFNDRLFPDTILHAHSRDAAQQGFYAACKTMKELKRVDESAHYPHRRKWYRTTTWKNTGIIVRDGRMRLALARGHEPIIINLPDNMGNLDQKAYRQVELVYDQSSRHYQWHITIDDGVSAPEQTSDKVIAVDLGEIHPAVMTDGETATIITCRELRSVRQYTNKRLSELVQLQSTCTKQSRRWKKLQARKNRFLAEQCNKIRDMEHKISRAVVDTAVESGTGVIAIGDVRDVADKTREEHRLRRTSRQKISNWSHGKQRQYIEYKAAAKGIRTVLVDEHYTSKTCPQCGHLNKPKGRNYRCSSCGFVGHRDCVGASNILSRHKHGELAKVLPPKVTKYRIPFRRVMRSLLDTGQVANAQSLEAVGL